MSEVSFYVIQTQISQAELACRICRKSLSTGQVPVLVKFEQQAVLEEFDNLLWQFDASSFVPHDSLSSNSLPSSSVLNGSLSNKRAPGVLENNISPIYLSLHIPEQFQGMCLNMGQQAVQAQKFNRVIEIIDNNPAAREAGRLRFKAYREQGIEPITHHV